MSGDFKHPLSSPPRTSPYVLVWPLALCVVLLVVLNVTVLRPPHPFTVLPEMNATNLVHTAGQWCLAGGSNLFTGILIETYPGGALQSRSMVSNGWLQGLSEGWYTNGQLQVQEYFRTNYSDGLRTKWYPNGKKQSEAPVALGKIEGQFRRWYDNGQLAEEVPMRAGKIEGLGRTYYRSGSLKSEVTIHDGAISATKSWADGEEPAPTSR